MSGIKGILWTLCLVGIWSVLGSLAMYNWDLFNMGSSDWRAVTAALIAAIGAFLTNYLAPFIPRYGIGKA